MSVHLTVPRDLVEAFAALRLPLRMDARLQTLMDRNTNGELSPEEREELAALVEWTEDIALLKARALTALGERPK